MDDNKQHEQPEGMTALLREYDRETDPEKKKALLDRMDKNDEAVRIRKALFDRRFAPAKDTGYPDKYLYALIQILQMRNEGKGPFGIKRKRIIKELEVFGYAGREDHTAAEEDAMHSEVVNAALRYFKTCLSPEYRRKLFGTMTPSDAERRAHIRNDAYDMSYGFAARMDLQKEASFLCRAVPEAYAIFAPEEPPLLPA